MNDDYAVILSPVIGQFILATIVVAMFMHLGIAFAYLVVAGVVLTGNLHERSGRSN